MLHFEIAKQNVLKLFIKSKTNTQKVFKLLDLDLLLKNMCLKKLALYLKPQLLHF